MLQPVAHHQEVYVEQKVIYGYLVEHLLGDGDVGRLVLDNHPGAQVAAIEHAVGTQHLVAAFELNLVGKQSGRIALVLYEEVDEMLAHLSSGVSATYFLRSTSRILGCCRVPETLMSKVGKFKRIISLF